MCCISSFVVGLFEMRDRLSGGVSCWRESARLMRYSVANFKESSNVTQKCCRKFVGPLLFDKFEFVLPRRAQETLCDFAEYALQIRRLDKQTMNENVFIKRGLNRDCGENCADAQMAPIVHSYNCVRPNALGINRFSGLLGNRKQFLKFP
jgi:hypothetical protein